MDDHRGDYWWYLRCSLIHDIWWWAFHYRMRLATWPRQTLQAWRYRWASRVKYAYQCVTLAQMPLSPDESLHDISHVLEDIIITGPLATIYTLRSRQRCQRSLIFWSSISTVLVYQQCIYVDYLSLKAGRLIIVIGQPMVCKFHY